MLFWKKGSGAAKLAILIKTGLTHQIRAHLREQGMILLGEGLYNAGLPEPPIQAPRVMLHAKEVCFQHPANHQTVKIAAPIPMIFDQSTRLSVNPKVRPQRFDGCHLIRPYHYMIQ